MGVVLAENFFGGSFFQALSENWTFKWNPRTRLRVVTVASGLTITLPPASKFPDGLHGMVIVNGDNTDSFTLVDQEATMSQTVAAQQAAIVSKIGGTLRADLRDVL